MQNPLDRIQANAPDEVFNQPNQDKANKEIDDLFGKEAKKSFHELSTLGVRILGFIILLITAITLIIRTWHLLAPNKWYWLDTDALNQIDHILLVIFAAISARFFPSTLSNTREK